MTPNRFLPLVIHIIMKAILNQSLQRCSPDINIDEKGEGNLSLRKKSNVINVAGANQKQVRFFGLSFSSSQFQKAYFYNFVSINSMVLFKSGENYPS